MFGTYEHDLDIEYHKKKAMGLMVSKEVKRRGYKNLNKFAPVDDKIDLLPGLNWNFEYFQSSVPVGLHTDYTVDEKGYELVAGVIIPLYWTCLHPYTISYDKFTEDKLMYKHNAMRNEDDSNIIDWQTKEFFDPQLFLHFPKGVKYRKQVYDLKALDIYKWNTQTAYVFNTKQWHNSSWFLKDKELPSKMGGPWKLSIIGFGSRKKLPKI